MIDIKREEVILLHDARRFFPRQPGGGRLALSTLQRWVGKGKQGVVLESIKMGKRRCTSVEAVQRFCDALTALDGDGQAEQPQTVSAREEAAREKLKEKGWL